MNKRFLLSLFLLVGSALVQAEGTKGYVWQEQIKNGYKSGFLKTCMPNSEAQLQRAGIRELLSQSQIISYCTCVAIAIFDDFTLEEIEEFNRSEVLPRRKQAVRQSFSNQCADQHLELQ